MAENCAPICKLEIFIPSTHFVLLQEALRGMGAGHIGNYDSCLSYSPVTGCWRPLSGARPYNGKVGKLQEAAEYKVEVCCETSRLMETLAAIRAVHPYEEPVINAIPLIATGFTLFPN